MEITSENHPLTNEGNHLQRRQQQYQHKILYAVQRYRHSGPRHYAPMDMLRLFHNQREAEEAAYHSAKAFYEATNTGANTNTNSSSSSSSSIKTLLLPSSLPSNNPQGSSFGFLASGGLFWVRALRATIITTGVEIETHPVSESNSQRHNRPFYAIMTEGVIGGTGNPNSRRGMEIGDGRVFGGDATACAIAMGAVARVQQQVNCETTARTNRLRVEAKVVPVGKPPNADRWYSSGVFLKDCWAEEQVMSENFDAAMDDGSSSSTTTTTKRQIHFSHSVFDCDQGYVQRSVSQEPDEGSQQSACLFVVDNNENLLVVDCPFEQPVAKRRRLVSVSEESYPSYNTNISINSNSNSNNFDYFGVMADISNGNQHDDDSVVMMQ